MTKILRKLEFVLTDEYKMISPESVFENRIGHQVEMSLLINVRLNTKSWQVDCRQNITRNWKKFFLHFEDRWRAREWKIFLDVITVVFGSELIRILCVKKDRRGILYAQAAALNDATQVWRERTRQKNKAWKIYSRRCLNLPATKRTTFPL